MLPCAEGAQARRCSSGLLGIPERLAAWKSLTEDVNNTDTYSGGHRDVDIHRR